MCSWICSINTLGLVFASEIIKELVCNSPVLLELCVVWYQGNCSMPDSQPLAWSSCYCRMLLALLVDREHRAVVLNYM